MKKINFALVSDVLFFAVCTFLISFTAVRYYLKSAVTALIVALGCAAAAAAAAFLILLGKRKKKILGGQDERNKKSLALHLSVCDVPTVLNLFESALDGTYIRGNRLCDGENLYFFHFKLSPVTPDDIAEIIKYKSPKQKRLYCCEASPSAASLAEDFGIKIADIKDIYLMLKDKKLLPEKYALGDVKKQSVLQRVKKRFNRKLCPSLFLCGLSLLFFSFFTFYPVYYVISGGILTALAAVSVLISQPS